jgi:hypothetical protein
MISKRRRLSWKEWSLLLILCWIAFGVRMHRLDDRSLWLDEGISWHRASQDLPSVLRGEILQNGGETTAPMPPLYFLWLAAIRRIGGDSEVSLRLTGVWTGLLMVPLLFALGTRLFDRTTGFAAAFLCALSPYGVWYARTARPEPLLLALVVLSFLALHRLLTTRRPHLVGGLLWILATAATVYTHQAGVWVLVFELLVIGAFVLRRRGRFELLAGALIVVLLTLPVAHHVGQPDSPAGFRPPWYDARQLIHATQAEGDHPPDESTSIPPSTAPLTMVRLLPAGLLLLASAIWALRRPRQTRSWALTVGFLLAPPLAGVLITRLGPYPLELYNLLVVIPAALLLQGAGTAALWHRWRPLAIVALVAVASVMVYWLSIQLGDPVFSSDDLGVAAAYATEHAQDEDAIVLQDVLTQFVWDYYYDGVAPVTVIPQDKDVSEQGALSQLRATMQKHKRIWFLSQPGPRADLEADVLQDYLDSRWVKFDEQGFSSPWLEVTLEGFMASPPVVEMLPAEATTSALCWRTGLCLHGWLMEQPVLGREAQVSLFWSQSRPTDYQYILTLVLQDAEGQRWSESNDPLSPYYPAPRWPIGAMVERAFWLHLSPALPLAPYSLTLAVQRRSDEGYLVADTGNVFNTVGMITPERPAEPIDPGRLQLQYRNDAVFGETVRLLGYNLPNDVPRPGHITFIDFYWQALQAPGTSWQQRTRLIGGDGTVWVEETGPITLTAFDLPQWRTGDLVWGRIYLPLPGQMPAGEYRVEVALLDPDGEAIPAKEIWRSEAAQSIIAGPAYLQNWPKVTEPPEMPHRPDLIFGGSIRLWGFEITGEPRPGGELEVTLVWHDELPVEGDYHVFLHLMDANGILLGQADGVPANWTRPTSTWRPGEYISDQHTIPIAAGLPTSVAYLWVGLYHPSGEGRVPVSNPAPDQPTDRALLDILVIEP